MLRINPKENKLQDEIHKTNSSCERSTKYEGGHNTGTEHSACSALLCNSLHFHVHALFPQTRTPFDCFSMKNILQMTSK